MSVALMLGCPATKTELWIGQRSAGARHGYFYHGDKHNQLFEHFMKFNNGHALYQYDDLNDNPYQEDWKDYWYQFHEDHLPDTFQAYRYEEDIKRYWTRIIQLAKQDDDWYGRTTPNNLPRLKEEIPNDQG